jgi:hypothetical protein
VSCLVIGTSTAPVNPRHESDAISSPGSVDGAYLSRISALDFPKSTRRKSARCRFATNFF